MEHIKKTFNRGSVNEFTLFDDFNLKIRCSEYVSVVGSNGSGRPRCSTSCGTTGIDAGRVWLGDRDISNMKEQIEGGVARQGIPGPGKGTCPSLTYWRTCRLVQQGSPYGLTRG